MNQIKPGDIFQLGKHRLMCGDSTSPEAVGALLGGKKADLVFTDPPYGMKKEGQGIANDNLNYNDLLEFNRQWIPLSFEALKENGSWYCWGQDEPLMDIYSEILKPMKQNKEITFRNLLTWDKGTGQGQRSPDFRMYPTADEKALFCMKGVQGFDINTDNYFEGWEPIRLYFCEERKKSGLHNKDISIIFSKYTNKTGKQDRSVIEHYFRRGQWVFPTKEIYENVLQKTGYFKRDYEEIKRDYEEIKRDYEEIKRDYYNSRAYFDNTHDNQNNVWHFSKASTEERQWCPTTKPFPVCARAIKSSSREGEIVLDLFGGGGSTLIACERLNRVCYMMELLPESCEKIIQRYEQETGDKAILII